jgi:hypothetical protein
VKREVKRGVTCDVKHDSGWLLQRDV